MRRLHRIELSEVYGRLPEVRPLDTGDASVVDADLFLATLGFEERALSVPRALAEAGVRADHARYFTYATNAPDNRSNETQLVASLGAISDDVEELFADDREGLERFDGLVRDLGRARGTAPHVVLDISVASNRLILRAMKRLLDAGARLTVVYAEAASYFPSREQFEADPEEWTSDERLGLERGVGDLDLGVEYPGHALDPLPDLLLIFPGFSRERAQAVLSAVDPNLLVAPEQRVTWFVGRPHEIGDAWRLDAMRQVNRLSDSDRQVEVSTFEYREALSVLDGAARLAEQKFRVTLSPMGSKLQALGASLFCFMHPSVRVIFATPVEYNAAQYSEGCRRMWVIDFGPLVEVRALLDSVGKLKLI